MHVTCIFVHVHFIVNHFNISLFNRDLLGFYINYLKFEGIELKFKNML